MGHLEVLGRLNLAGLAGGKEVKELELSNMSVDARDMELACEVACRPGVVALGMLRRILLGFNSLKCAGIGHLMALLGEKCFLITLEVGFNAIGDEGVKSIVKYLHTTQSLKTLYLSGNVISAVGFEFLGQALADNCCLEELHLSANRGQTRGASALAAGLRTNYNLQTLAVGNNDFGESGCRLLFSALSGNSDLTSLDVGNNGSCDGSMSSLATALEARVSSLSAIDLSFNHISSSGLTILLNVLASHDNLTALELKKNVVGDEGAKALAVYLRDSRRLKKLGLGFNDIRSEGMIAIASALTPNVSLESLTLSGNPIKSDAMRHLGDMLSRDHELLHLHLDNVFVHAGESGEWVLASVIASNRALRLRTLTGFNLSATLIQLGSPAELAGLSNEAALRHLQDMWAMQLAPNPPVQLRYQPLLCLSGPGVSSMTKAVGAQSCRNSVTNAHAAAAPIDNHGDNHGDDDDDDGGHTDDSGASDEGECGGENVVVRALSRLSMRRSSGDSADLPITDAQMAHARGRHLSEELEVIDVTEAVKLWEGDGTREGQTGPTREKRQRSMSSRSMSVQSSVKSSEYMSSPYGNSTSPSTKSARLQLQSQPFLSPGLLQPFAIDSSTCTGGDGRAGKLVVNVENIMNWPVDLIQATVSVGNQPFVGSELWELDQFYFSPDPEIHHPGQIRVPQEGLGFRIGDDSMPPMSLVSSDNDGSISDLACTTAAAVTRSGVAQYTHGQQQRPLAKRYKNDASSSSVVLRVSKYPRLFYHLEDLKKRNDEVCRLAVLRQLKFVEGYIYNLEVDNRHMCDPAQIETLILDVIHV